MAVRRSIRADVLGFPMPQPANPAGVDGHVNERYEKRLGQAHAGA